jgi:hypothetical protein
MGTIQHLFSVQGPMLESGCACVWWPSLWFIGSIEVPCLTAKGLVYIFSLITFKRKERHWKNMHFVHKPKI